MPQQCSVVPWTVRVYGSGCWSCYCVCGCWVIDFLIVLGCTVFPAYCNCPVPVAILPYEPCWLRCARYSLHSDWNASTSFNHSVYPKTSISNTKTVWSCAHGWKYFSDLSKAKSLPLIPIIFPNPIDSSEKTPWGLAEVEWVSLCLILKVGGAVVQRARAI